MTDCENTYLVNCFAFLVNYIDELLSDSSNNLPISTYSVRTRQ